MGALAELRTRVAAALAPSNGDGWDVYALPVDAVIPPAFMLIWSDPWLEPATHCAQTARLDIVAIANRIDVEPGAEILEGLIEHATGALIAARLPAVRTAPPGPFAHGGITYLAARITLSYPVTL